MTSQDTDAARQFYTRISRVYDALADADERRAREMGVEFLDARAGERVVEVGFGTGTSVVLLARGVGVGGHVLGVDIADGMREVAERRVASEGLSDVVELRTAAVPPLPVTDGGFDAAFMAFTLELFPDDTLPLVLRDVRRALKRPGRLVVVAMDVGDERQRQTVAERTYQWTHRHFPHIVDCRPIDSAGQLRSEGFTVTRTQTLEILGPRREGVFSRDVNNGTQTQAKSRIHRREAQRCLLQLAASSRPNWMARESDMVRPSANAA